MYPKQIRNVVWAMDAFTDDPALERKAAAHLKALTSGLPAQIFPVTVLSPDQLVVPPDYLTSFASDVERDAMERLRRRLARHKIAGIATPEIQLSRSFSLRSAVHTLLGFARSKQADLIVVSTQSKKGVNHFFFGSFAETLILQSDIPVFIVSPKTAPPAKKAHILFPTDLSEASQYALESVINLAKEKKARVTVFHKLEYLNQYTYSTFANSELYSRYLREDIDRRRKLLQATVARLEMAGIKTDWTLDDKSSRSMADCIVAAARKSKAGVIAMAAQAGPVASAVLGSTTRQVIRLSSCPLWILHPSKVEQAAASLPTRGPRPKEAANF